MSARRLAPTAVRRRGRPSRQDAERAFVARGKLFRRSAGGVHGEGVRVLAELHRREPAVGMSSRHRSVSGWCTARSHPSAVCCRSSPSPSRVDERDEHDLTFGRTGGPERLSRRGAAGAQGEGRAYRQVAAPAVDAPSTSTSAARLRVDPPAHARSVRRSRSPDRVQVPFTGGRAARKTREAPAGPRRAWGVRPASDGRPLDAGTPLPAASALPAGSLNARASQVAELVGEPHRLSIPATPLLGHKVPLAHAAEVGDCPDFG